MLIGVWLRVVIILSTQFIKRFLLVFNGEVVHKGEKRVHGLVIRSQSQTPELRVPLNVPNHTY